MSQSEALKTVVSDQPTPRVPMSARFGRIDPAALAKAQAALKSLSSEFAVWLEEEVSRLKAAREALHAAQPSSSTFEAIYARAHDLKGVGATYDYPLLTRIAGSLCKLMGGSAQCDETLIPLIDAHVDAADRVMREGMRDPETPEAVALIETLERTVAAQPRG